MVERGQQACVAGGMRACMVGVSCMVGGVMHDGGGMCGRGCGGMHGCMAGGCV